MSGQPPGQRIPAAAGANVIVEVDAETGKLTAWRQDGRTMCPSDAMIVRGLFQRGAIHPRQLYEQEKAAHEITLAAYNRAEQERDELATANAALDGQLLKQARELAHLRSRETLYKERFERLQGLAKQGVASAVFQELLLADVTEEHAKGDP